MSKLVKWKWRDYYTLVEDGERRHYVLSILGTGCELLTWDVDNRKLVPLTPEHPIAERIRAIPETEASRDELLEALQDLVAQFRAWRGSQVDFDKRDELVDHYCTMRNTSLGKAEAAITIANAVKDADATPA